MITRDDLGWVNISGNDTYGEFIANDYENAYPSVTKITNKFMKIRPYAVDSTGEKVEAPVLDALYHPNRKNSSVEFREAIVLMYLVHPQSHILLWRKEGNVILPGGRITSKNIGGFTFLQNPTTVNVNGKITYTITTPKGTSQYSEDEVITLGGLDPYAINTGGYSPTRAARKWTTIDDYIAQYQKGFFKNGAVPTGEFVITAQTAKDFNDVVDKLQERHRGAGKNGNVTYTHRPVDPNTNKPLDAQIEWIPFATPNRELSLNDLFTQANKKIDSAFGVPASIRGVGENNNYATARTDQQNFMENVVEPITLKIWTQFTHELNRITGGLGVQITADVPIPALADEEKVQEETGAIRDARFIILLDKGYTPESIEIYFKSHDINDLIVGIVSNDVVEDNPDIDEGDEVQDSPEPDNAGLKPTNKGTAKSTNPKASSHSPEPAVDAELVPYELDIENALNAQINRQASRVSVSPVSLAEDPTEQENDDLTEEILAILLLLFLMRGQKVYNSGLLLAMSGGLDISGTAGFTGSVSTQADRIYMKEVVKSFNADTSSELSKLIETNKLSGQTVTKQALAAFVLGQTFRVKRFSQNEAWRTSETSGNKAMIQLNVELNATQIAGTYKIWNIQDSACFICRPLAGITIGIKELFPGGLDSPPAHVNCRCKLSYSIIKGNANPTNIEGKDPSGIYAENGRYLGKKLGGGMVSIKNPTSKLETVVKV